MTRQMILDTLTDAGGTIDRLHTVELTIDCLRAREEAYLGDENLYRGLIAVTDMVRGVRSDVQAAADFLSGERESPVAS